MARYVIADLVSIASDHVSYLIQEGDEVSDTHPQTVQIKTDEDGAYLRGSEAVTVSGEPLWRGTSTMVGKLAHLRRQHGEWPKKATLQS